MYLHEKFMLTTVEEKKTGQFFYKRNLCVSKGAPPQEFGETFLKYN